MIVLPVTLLTVGAAAVTGAAVVDAAVVVVCGAAVV